MMLLELMTSATLLAGIQRTVVPHAATAPDDQQRQMIFWADEAVTWRRVFA